MVSILKARHVRHPDCYRPCLLVNLPAMSMFTSTYLLSVLRNFSLSAVLDYTIALFLMTIIGYFIGEQAQAVSLITKARDNLDSSIHDRLTFTIIF